LHTTRCKGRGYKDVYWKMLKNRGWEIKGSGRVFGGIEQTKAKQAHSGRHPFECQPKY
jgi:hypothetical protein